MRVVLMNCAIITSTGTFIVEKISHTKAVELCRAAEIVDIYAEIKINKEKLLDDWEDAGCLLTWDIPQDD